MNVMFVKNDLHRAGALTAHKRKHTAEKPYEFDFCNKRFTLEAAW